MAPLLWLAGCALSPVELEGKACDGRSECIAGYECVEQRCVRFVAGGSGDGDDPVGGGGDGDGGGGVVGTGGGPGGGAGDIMVDLPDAGEPVPPPRVCDPLPAEPPPGECPGICTGGCDGIVCTVDCLLPYSCSLGPQTCPPGYFCHFNCVGPGACTPPNEFLCGAEGCTVSCAAGTGACSGAALACGTGACEMTCPTGGSGDGAIAPTVNCGDSCDCAGACI